MLFKIGALKNFAILPSALQMYLKETPTKVFSYEICKILKNTCFYRTPLIAASVISVSLTLKTKL